MATEPTRKIGSIDCPVCGENMPVRQNGRDTLNISCPWCGVSSYAKGGSEAHRIITGWLRHDVVPAPLPVAAAPEQVLPEPVPHVARPAKHASAMPWEL